MLEKTKKMKNKKAWVKELSKDGIGTLANNFEMEAIPPELIKEEIRMLVRMFQTLPHEIRGNENSIKKLKKHSNVTKEKVNPLWGISVYLDPDLPDDVIKLVGKKKTLIINIKED